MQQKNGQRRSRIVSSVLMVISLAFIAIGIGIILFSETPRVDQFLWAAGLGIGAALLASDNSKTRDIVEAPRAA
jgi:hypothetical protein